MLQFFRENRIFNYVFVLIYLIGIRLFTFFEAYGPLVDTDSAAFYLLGEVNVLSPWAYKVISILLLFYHIAYINRLVGINKLAVGNSLFPGIFYILLISIFPDIHPLSSVLIGNTFFIIAIFNLFQIIHRNQRSKRMFNTGFFICLAAIWNIEFLWFFPFFILAGNSLVAIKKKDIILYLIGLSIPIYFTVSYLLLKGELSAFYQDFILQLKYIDYPFVYENYGIVKVGCIGLLTLFIFISFNNLVNRTNIFVRNKLNFIFYLLTFGWIVFGLAGIVKLEDTMVLTIPLSILLGTYFLQINRHNISESFHFLLLLIALMFQYFLI